MRYAHEVADIRPAEAALMATLRDGALMQRAAGGLASTCVDLLGSSGGVYGRRVVLLVGSGDNGGDALYAGARLASRGAAVSAVLLAPERAHAGGLAAFRAAGGRIASDDAVPLVEGADLVVDGIVGIGGHGGLRPDAAILAAAAAGVGATVVAVDLPSGVDADTGVAEGAAVRAAVTVTFGTHKPGLFVDPGASHAGVVVLVDIGLAPYLPAPALESLQAPDVAALLPMPDAVSDKYRRGVVGVVAGSATYVGAAVLAVAGAMRGGVGLVRFAGEPGVAAGVRAASPEAIVTEVAAGDDPTSIGRVQAWVIGPGHGTDDPARAQLGAVLGTDAPVILDAAALSLLETDPSGSLVSSLLRDRTAPTLLTPHAGELARLLGVERSDVEARRVEHVRRAADTFGVTVLLKGSTTLVADPAEAGTPVRANATGTPWLATAGSGDVLSGLCGALLAAGLSPRDAGSAAAYLHGLAGRLASTEHGAGDVGGSGGPIAARDIAERIPAAWARTATLQV